MLRRVALGLLVVCFACERQGSTTPDDATAQDGAGAGEDDGDAPDDAAEEPAPTPKVEQELKIDGAIKKADLDKVIETYFNEIRACFDGGLSRNPNEIEGAIVVKIQVAAGGNVELAQGELNETGDEETEACIVGEVQKWTFPKKKQPTTIFYPFYLRSY